MKQGRRSRGDITRKINDQIEVSALSRETIGYDPIPTMGATFTIAPFQGATFCIDALRERSGFVLRTTP
jgi:hypothetical protein